jgi:anti-sigma-K factor RskA
MSGSASVPSDIAALAGEYVLGTLDAAGQAAVRRAMETDAALRNAVAEWEAHLAPLTRLAPPEAPPPDLWDRIATHLWPAAAAPAETRRGRLSWLWRGWAIGATLVAAAFAAIAFLPRAPDTRYMTVLVSDRSQSAWTAQVDRNGAITLAAVAAAGGARADQTPDGRVLQLWGLPPGATAPTSLGLLPASGGRVSIATPAVRPVAGMLIEISLEPTGGSTTGRPTGPVLFIGRLTEAGPPT